MIASFALLFAAQAQVPQIDLGGVRTQAAIPKWTPDLATESRLTADGWTYHFRSGNLIARSKSGGGWDEIAGPNAEDPKTIAWPIKFYVTGSLDQIGQTDVGLWLPKRYSIDGDDMKGLRNEIALFAHMVRQYTNGRFTILPDFEADTEVRLLEPNQTVESALKDVLAGRLITAKPYRSCFAITPELDFQPRTGVVGSVPTTYFPFFASFDLEAPGQVARALYNAWVEQVQAAAAREGYPIDSQPIRYPERSVGRTLAPLHHLDDAIRPRMLEDLADAETPNVARNTPSASAGSDWNAVKDNPWSQLPLFTAEKMREMGVEYRSIPEGVSLGKTEFQFDKAGSVSDGTRLWVQDRYADLFASKLAGRKALGYLPVGGRVLVAFEGTGASSDEATLGVKPEIFGMEAGPAQTALPFDADQAEKLAYTGYFLRKTIVDNDRGAVGEIRQYPRPRHGWVRLLGYGTDQVMFDAAKTPFVEFWFKAGIGAQPIELVAQTPTGSKRFALFGRSLARKGHPSEVTDLQVNADGSWQKLVVDLRAGDKSSSLPVTSLYLAAPPEGAYWSPPNPFLPILIDDLKVTDQPSAPAVGVRVQSNPVAIAEAADPYSRALWAATVADDPAKLRTLLADKDYVVMLNALIKFGDRKDPAAIPMLIPTARSFVIRASRLAYNALAAQDSDEAFTAIAQSLTQGPFDWNKREGARLIVTRDKSSKLASQLSLLFVSPSWETRRQAARSLAQVEGEAAKIVSMSFVNATEPAVRQTCIEVADVKVNQVAERLQGLLDPNLESSDYIRALAAAKLLESPKESQVAAAWKSASTLTPEAMVVFVQHVPAKPEFRAGVEALGANSSPAVKAAVQAWLKGSGGL